jgi:glutamine---fructose-6-phosphate transaminase (isomerizing)
VVVVHNGIIENYLEVKEQLVKRGVAVQLGDRYRDRRSSGGREGRARHGFSRSRAPLAARDHGVPTPCYFSTGAIPKGLIVAKNSTPIVIGWGDGETFVASDIPALLDYTRKVTFLEDGEIGEVTPGACRLFNGKGQSIHRPVKEITWDAVAARKGGYPHFMLKEIHDQPRALADTFRGRIALKDGSVALENIKFKTSEAKAIKRIHLVACGTAWHACLVGKFLLEEIAGIPAEVDYGSEFRYRSPLMDPKSVLLMVSQSGETADTLAAVDIALAKEGENSFDLQRHRRFDPAQIARRSLHPRRSRRSASPAPRHLRRSWLRFISWPSPWAGSTANSKPPTRASYCAI